MASIQLQGKIFIIGEIEAVTGLHIGGSAGELDIGGVDNPVIRNPLTREPYIPGSSLRGKMRSLLDRHLDRPLNKSIRRNPPQVRVHECDKSADYKECSVCQVFGIAPTRDIADTMPTRLIVRDALLTAETRERFDQIDTDMPYTEIKTEVAIDRITSAATPRQGERVPAEAIFGPLEMVYSLYTLDSDSAEGVDREISLFDAVLTGMELLEDDYLGGSGSRGSGKIAFRDLQMAFKSRQHYEDPQSVPVTTLVDGDGVAALRETNYQNQILEAIQA
jgi:CRISPR-associated protein Csm3